MMCYRDMTFCPESTCGNWQSCHRALTDKVKADAERWLKNPPIAVYIDRPECFEPLTTESKENTDGDC